MSILIKGMEMPDNCRECPFEMYYMNCGQTRCRATGKILADFYKPIPFDGRAEECPLIEVPIPHGRLIDADDLNELICSGDDLDFDEVPETKIELMRMINDAPTIIEAGGT